MRLYLCAGKRFVDRRYLAGAIAAIVAETVDVDPIVRGIRGNLEVDGLSDIAADLGCEALNVGAAGPVDAPLALGVALLRVLQRDLVRCRRRGAGIELTCSEHSVGELEVFDIGHRVGAIRRTAAVVDG